MLLASTLNRSIPSPVLVAFFNISGVTISWNILYSATISKS